MTEGTTGSTVPRRQLGRYLRDLRNRSRLTVRAAAAALEWRFARSGKGVETEPPTVYAESLTGAVYLDKLHEIQRYDRAFTDMWKSAMDETASTNLIRRVAKELRT